MVLDVIPQIMIVDRIQSFLEPWPTLAKERHWKTFVANGQVNPEMINKMDIIHCNWGDALAASLSQRRWPGKLSVMVRSYEAYAGFLANMNWDNVDLLMFVAPHIQQYVNLAYPESASLPCHFVPTCIDVEKFPLKKDLSPGNRVACIGRIGAPKNVEFLVNAAYEFPDYEFVIKGPKEDMRSAQFLAYHQAKLDNLIIDGPGGPEGSAWFAGHGVNELLEECHYIASPSYHESTHVTILEGMAKGLVPLVQDRPGAVYPDTYCSMTDFGEKLASKAPAETYREWVTTHRNMPRMEAAVDAALDALAPSPIIQP